MQRIRMISFVALLAGCGSLDAAAQVSNDNEYGVNMVDEAQAAMEQFVPGELLVKFKEEIPISVKRVKGRYGSTSASSVDDVLAKYAVHKFDKLLPAEEYKPQKARRQAVAPDGRMVTENSLDQLFHLQIASENPDSVMMLVEELKGLEEVEYAEPNYYCYISGAPVSMSAQSFPTPLREEDDTEASSASGDVICTNPGQNPLYLQQWGIKALNIDQLWNKPIVNSKRPVIAILDTGVDINHPDLKDNIWSNPREAEGETGYDDDGNGFVDDLHGWDFVYDYPEMYDNNSHGTHVAGIAAASDNALGIIGANPKALIMPIKVMDDNGTGNLATIIKGIDYAVKQGADVINMSLGMDKISYSMVDVLENAYITSVIVAAAGNSCKNIYDYLGPSYPAAYYCVIGVQATSDDQGTLANFSNYDPDGPIYSRREWGGELGQIGDPTAIFGLNYEVKAPGNRMLSTVLDGKYAMYDGTSMAAPLVAGAISALKMVKDGLNNDMLMTDLAHLDCDFAKVYSIDSCKPDIHWAGMVVDDRLQGNKYPDGQIDAGETLHIYPVLLNGWGISGKVDMHLEVDANQKAYVKIENSDLDFGYSMSAYGHQKSKTPFIVHISDELDNEEIIKFNFICKGEGFSKQYEYYVTIKKMAKIAGVLKKDTVLSADVEWYVPSTLLIMKGVTMTIEPGTKMNFENGAKFASLGRLIADGTPKDPILLRGYKGTEWGGIESHLDEDNNPMDKISYCRISNGGARINMENCEISNVKNGVSIADYNTTLKRCNITSSSCGFLFLKSGVLINTNIINNLLQYIQYSYLTDCNFIHNYYNDGKNKYYALGILSNKPVIDHAEHPSYLGTAREEYIRPYIYEFNTDPSTYGFIDLSNMPSKPYAAAHGILWKVVVNGKDCQDEFDQMDPLGVGSHKVELYFNRPMNVAKEPKVSFGLCPPFSSHTLNDGTWSADSLVYTMDLEITGRELLDGINRFYVRGAEDNEYFECPYDSTRFNIMIQTAGTLATGFYAEAGMGRVKLGWDNKDNNFTDAMGFNIYRYGDAYMHYYPGYYDENRKWHPSYSVMAADTVKINRQILPIETVSYTDEDVQPGETYRYYYTVLSTDLKEYDVSNTVAATPLTSVRGDANASGQVDVADVITTVNYVAGMNPRPFIYEAADMNEDKTIDILDVVHIIKTIINPEAQASIMSEAVATYTVENGTLYVESPVALAGVQVQLATDRNQQITVSDNLDEFEHASAWLSDYDWLFLAYNMNGKTLPAGKNALLHIGDARIASVCLSDAMGRNVKAVGKDVTGVERMGSDVMHIEGVYTLSGRKLSGKAEMIDRLPSGVYIVNGKKIVK